MGVGLTVYDMGSADVIELGRAADALGFDGIWLGEHVFRPLEYASAHPKAGSGDDHHTGKKVIDTDTELADPFLLAAALSTTTTSLQLATGIHLLTLRHPLLSARMAATMHDLSGGRFRFGVGAGWLREEFDALGISYASRISRFEESIAVLRGAFSGEAFEFHGRHYDFDAVQVTPQPLDIPLILAGNSEPAMRRAVTLGDGWISSGAAMFDECLRLRDEIEHHRTELRAAEKRFVTYFHVAPCDEQTLERYRAEGIDNLVFTAQDIWGGADAAERSTRLSSFAASASLQPSGTMRDR